jgi:hypothetical protein
MPPKLLIRADEAVLAERALSPEAKPPSAWRSGDALRTWSPPGKKRSPMEPGGASRRPWMRTGQVAPGMAWHSRVLPVRW